MAELALPRTELLRVAVTDDVADAEVTVAVDGVIDLSTAPMLERALCTALTRGQAPARVNLDIRALRFLDASGVSVSLRAWHLAEGRGTRLRLIGPTPFVRRVLAITGVTEVCEVVPR